MHDYMTECCLTTPSETITVSELHKAWISWCAENGDTHPIGKNTFTARMREKGFQSARGTDNKLIWRGIRLLTEEEKITLSTKNSRSSHTRARKGSSGKNGNESNESNLSNYPDKPCVQCGQDDPILNEEMTAYKCSKCDRFYTVKV